MSMDLAHLVAQYEGSSSTNTSQATASPSPVAADVCMTDSAPHTPFSFRVPAITPQQVKPHLRPPSVTPYKLAVEACIQPNKIADEPTVKAQLTRFLQTAPVVLSPRQVDFSSDPYLAGLLSSLRVSPFGLSRPPPGQCTFGDLTASFRMFLYQLHSDGAMEELTEATGPGSGPSGAAEEDSVVACHHWQLPAIEFEGLWESLHFDEAASRTKDELLSYCSTAMVFADCKVDQTLVGLNRVVLLYGPPGTGKTTLCKGLVQKLAIRLQDRFSQAVLVEVNAHSLFSKWFSESGKLVMRLFQMIRELVADTDTLVCVLIDEVESLTSARQTAIANSEPSDAIRVVNAVLTQLDRLKEHSNTLVLTTSNLSQAIDPAFVDRVDMQFYIGPPSVEARFHILSSCLEELCRSGVIREEESVKLRQRSSGEKMSAEAQDLLAICEELQGSSGRHLRKLPVRAHALYVQEVGVSLVEFLAAMKSTVSRK